MADTPNSARKLSPKLKRRMAAFHRNTTYKKWWHDPAYLPLCDEIKKELDNA